MVDAGTGDTSHCGRTSYHRGSSLWVGGRVELRRKSREGGRDDRRMSLGTHCSSLGVWVWGGCVGVRRQ